ncbi:collagenase [Clostridium oceanicum]|uniref:microbial collagenase n=1 Tax=Clostridium oceanicum TaxID=1543 RepID=A0ABN1J925_9CLOT
MKKGKSYFATKKLKKIVSTTTLIAMLTTSTNLVFAKELVKGPAKNITSISQKQTKENSKKYTFRYLNSLSYNNLVSLIKDCSWRDIEGLFEYSQDSYAFFNNKDRVQAIIDELYKSSYKFTDTNDEGIPTLVEVLRAGFYLGYNNSQLKYLNERSFHSKCMPAIKAAQNNLYFKLGTEKQDNVVTSIGMLIGNASCDSTIVNGFNKIFDQYISNYDKYKNSKSKNNALFKIMDGVGYDIQSYLCDNYTENPKNSPWYGKINSYFDRLEKLSLVKGYSNDNVWLINRAIYEVSRLKKVCTPKDRPLKILTKVLKNHSKESKPYFEAAKRINDSFKGIDAEGNSVNFDQLKKDTINRYLPNTYKFDNGKMVIRAGNKVTKEKIQRLYFASREVRSQFFRVFGNDKAIEKGNPDDTLTMYLYNCPDDYQKINSLVFNYDTNNGGMYIEETGSFFTYERTKAQSRYTLEELFRHEYTHYLQGRYVVPGSFTQNPLYNNDRLTWYDEGGAEFFAGSTRTQNVLSRKSMVDGLRSTPRFTLNKTLHSKYAPGNFEFYKYSFALYDYLYNNDLDTLLNITKYVRNNDAAGYDKYMNELGSNLNLSRNYSNHMEKLASNYDNLTTPLVSDNYLKEYSYKNISDINKDISSISKFKTTSTSTGKSDFFDTFTVKQSFEGATSKGENIDWKEMNKKCNDILNDLSKLDWKGYKTINCYFTDYKVDPVTKKVKFNVVFHGKQGIKNFVPNKLPTANLTAPSNIYEDKEVSFSSNGSKDPDGKITSYLWDFGDGTKSSEANPNHTYKIPGKYKVTLKVIDNRKGFNEKTCNIEVKENISKKITEQEPNNDFKDANEISLSNTVVNATVNNKTDSKDVYCFKVKDPSKINISINNLSNDKINWVIYNSKDLNKHFNYDSIKSSQYNKKTVDIKEAGDYYLTVYNNSPNLSKYTLKVSGNIERPDKDLPVIKYEKEPNDSFEKANNVLLDKNIIDGNLTKGDNKDIYSFDVKSNKNVKISLDNLDNLKVNWILYGADKTTRVTYANKKGDKLENTCTLKPGKYYLLVYRTGSPNGNYSINLNTIK